MSTEDNKLPDDTQLSSLYSQSKDAMPASHIDKKILAAAKHEATSYSLPYNPFSNNWHIPASLAAVVLLSFGIVSLLENDLNPVDGIIPIKEEQIESMPEQSQLLSDNLDSSKQKTIINKPVMRKPAKLREPASPSPKLRSGEELAKRLKSKQSQKRKQKLDTTAHAIAESSRQDTFMTKKSIGQEITRSKLISSGIDEQTTLPYWQYKDKGISIRFVQRLPDQSRGYFIARGFSADDAELIAQSCVFQTIFKNISDNNTPSAVTYHMKNWRVQHKDGVGKMKTREKWAEQWQQSNIPMPAKLAFNWSLLPTTQDYQAGDYNWGMAIFNLKPAQSFSLTLTWQQYGKQHSATIPNMQCAADSHAEPEAP